jgi:hypothetical protein
MILSKSFFYSSSVVQLYEKNILLSVCLQRYVALCISQFSSSLNLTSYPYRSSGQHCIQVQIRPTENTDLDMGVDLDKSFLTSFLKLGYLNANKNIE